MHFGVCQCRKSWKVVLILAKSKHHWKVQTYPLMADRNTRVVIMVEQWVPKLETRGLNHTHLCSQSWFFSTTKDSIKSIHQFLSFFYVEGEFAAQVVCCMVQSPVMSLLLRM